MLLDIVNYAVRIIIVILGILLIFGVIMPPGTDDIMFRVMGVVFVLFGVYRIVMYRIQRKRYYRNSDDE